MADKKIAPFKTRALLRLVNDIVKLQIKYIDQGFGPQEIAETFAQIYTWQFEKLLTPEIVRKIVKASHQHSKPNNTNVAVTYSLNLSSAIMKAVVTRLKKERD